MHLYSILRATYFYGKYIYLSLSECLERVRLHKKILQKPNDSDRNSQKADIIVIRHQTIAEILKDILPGFSPTTRELWKR